MNLPTTTEPQRSEQSWPSVRTPFYLYDERRILDSLGRFRSIPYARTALHFATMANDNPFLLGLLRKEGFGVFVNSLKHLRAVLDAGFSTRDVIFASTGLSRELMGVLIHHQIHVNLDSLGQVALYGSMNPGSSIGIRINIDEKSKNNVFIGAESRIGILESEIPELFEIASRYKLRLTGTHVYLGTDLALQDVLMGVKRTLALSNRFPELEFVDLGGGFPIDPERFDFERYKTTVAALFEEYSQRRGRPIKMILEPGRSMFGRSGSFFTTVTDVKERPDRIIVCCDASASLIPRSMFYEDYNPVEVFGTTRRAPFHKPVDIVGSTTYSRDFLAKGIHLPVVEVGNKLIFGNAGSYCYSMITRFLGQALPPEFLKTMGGRFELIRAGEDFFAEKSR